MQKYAADVQLTAGAKHQTALADLNRTYAAALERAQKAAQDGGRLEEALALKNEAALMAGGGAVPPGDEGAPVALKNLRVIYRQSLARAEQERHINSAPLAKELLASLDQLVAALTKAGRLEDAVVVKQKKGSLSAAAWTPAALAGVTPVGGQSAFTNSLGMKFVPVKNTKVHFCIHETRRQDYAAYADKTSGEDDSWKTQNRAGIPCGDKNDHPVVGVSWEDAQKFCMWLSRKEGKSYRLPTDEEWSIAVGLGGKEKRSKDTTPEMLSGNETTEFPWEEDFPPSTKDKAGNYGDTSWTEKFPSEPGLKDYTDGFATTAPVMSFKANQLGLYDMGGNVWEWVEDRWNGPNTYPVLRGASFYPYPRNSLLSSYRINRPPNQRSNFTGFRVVLVTP